MAKAQVASLITRVENGVDEFRNYLEKRAYGRAAPEDLAATGARLYRGDGLTSGTSVTEAETRESSMRNRFARRLSRCERAVPLLWDLDKSFYVGFEPTWRKTEYKKPYPATDSVSIPSSLSPCRERAWI